MVYVTISKKFVGRANNGKRCNDEKLEKTSAKPSHMANVKGPSSSQQKSSRVATTTISNRANVKGPLSDQQKSSRVATTAVSNGANVMGPLSSQNKSWTVVTTTISNRAKMKGPLSGQHLRVATNTISNRENVKGPLSDQPKSSRVATSTISNRANVKGPLSSQQKSSRVVTATISNRANVKGPLSSQQKPSRVSITTLSNRENLKGPLSGQLKSSRMATTTISNRANVKGPLSGQPKSSRVAASTISNRANVKGPLSIKQKSSRVVPATISNRANIKGPLSGQQKLSRVATTTLSNSENLKGPLSGQPKSSRMATTTISNRENVKGPLSDQPKSSRVATSTISNRANLKGPLSSQQKSSRVAITTISNKANVKGPLFGQQKSCRLATTTVSNRGNVKVPLSGQQSSRMVTPTISSRANGKGPLSSQHKSSMVATTTISNRNTHLHSSDVKRNARSISKPHVVPRPFRFQTDERSIVRALNAERSSKLVKVNAEKSPKLVKRTSIDPLNFISCESSCGESLIEEGVGDYEFIMGSEPFAGHLMAPMFQRFVMAPLLNRIQFQQALVRMKNGWFLKLKCQAWMENLMHALTLPNRIQFQQALVKMKKVWFLKLNFKWQARMETLMHPLKTARKRNWSVELEKFRQMPSSYTYYLKWKASLFPETPASSATSFNNGVTDSSGKSFSDNAKSAIATKDDSVLKVGGSTPLEGDLDSMETSIDGSEMNKLLPSDCGDSKKRLITMANDLAPIVESSLSSFEENQCDQHSSLKKKEYIAGSRNSDLVNDSEYVKPRMTGSLSRNGYSHSIERVPKSSKAAVGSLHKQYEKEDFLNGTKPASSYKGLSNMTVIAKTSTRKFKLPAIPEDASVTSLSYCTRNVPPPSTKSLANVGAKNSRAVFTQKHDRNIDACTRKIAKGAGLIEKSMTLTLPTTQVGSLRKKKHIANSVSMDVIPRATRIGANRKSDSRSKEREKSDRTKCKELKLRLQFMEQRVDLQHALNDDLRTVVDKLELLASRITDPSTKGITQKSVVLSLKQCNVLSNGHRRRSAAATAKLLSAAPGK